MSRDPLPASGERVSARGRHIVVTGGTDGLGLALVRHYLACGDRVYVVARRERLWSDDGLPQPVFIGADLAAADACDRVLARLARAGVTQLDLLIHNAAAGWAGSIEEHDGVALGALVALNVWTPVALTQRALPLLEATHGKVVFIGSVAAFLPAARYATYAATKAALDGFARSLAQETRGGVAVQVVHPGAIRTGFHGRAGATWLDPQRFPSADRVARQVARAIERRGWRQFPDLPARVACVAGRWLRPVIDRIAQPAERARMRSPSTRDGARSSGPPLAIVTGAASGLGAALAARLLLAGYRVVGVDRPRSTAEHASLDARIEWVFGNLSHPAGIEQIAGELVAKGPSHLVVHCAGTSAVGEFARQGSAALHDVLWTNLVAPLQLTTRWLRAGACARGARFVLVSSLSHFVGYPGATVYAASKDGLAHFGRSLSVACAARGMHCLTVFPGPLRTPHARRFAPPGAREERRMAPEQAADAILAALARGRTRLVIGRGARLAALLGRVAPTSATRLMRRSLYERLRQAAAPP
jgi:short-subunit dehydrogenase